MTDSVTLRVVVHDPLPGVPLRMQRGRYELIAPVGQTAGTATFELHVQATERADGVLVLKGPDVQGPPMGRFVYVNADSHAVLCSVRWHSFTAEIAPHEVERLFCTPSRVNDAASALGSTTAFPPPTAAS